MGNVVFNVSAPLISGSSQKDIDIKTVAESICHTNLNVQLMSFLFTLLNSHAELHLGLNAAM